MDKSQNMEVCILNSEFWIHDWEFVFSRITQFELRTPAGQQRRQQHFLDKQTLEQIQRIEHIRMQKTIEENETNLLESDLQNEQRLEAFFNHARENPSSMLT